jgi:hypothetical protein
VYSNIVVLGNYLNAGSKEVQREVFDARLLMVLSVIRTISGFHSYEETTEY